MAEVYGPTPAPQQISSASSYGPPTLDQYGSFMGPYASYMGPLDDPARLFSSSNSASLQGDTDSKDSTMNYWEGLISTVGQENELNRIFNEEQARLNREYNTLEAEKSRAFNAAEADKARQWSEQMSNTSYQRAVLDLQKAGLNPILAYQQGGASSPTSSSASSSPASGQNASYNVGGGDTLSDLLDNFGSLISSVGGLFKKLFSQLCVKIQCGAFLFPRMLQAV